MKRAVFTLWLAFLLMSPAAFAGESRDFDGVDDRIDCGSASILDDLPALTLLAWIKPDNLGEGSGGRIAQKGSGTGPSDGWTLNLEGTNTLRFFVDYSGTNLTRKSANSAVTLGAWNHVAVAWDGSTAAANADIFVGGVETSYQSTISATSSRVTDASQNFIIGNNPTFARTFDGLIAHVHLYNRVLTPAEISQLKDSPGSITNGLVGYWPLTGTGSQELDASGNGNHGTVTGAAESAEGPPGGGDVTAPTVGIISPAGGAAVRGTVSVSATASDNVGVVGVQFKVDGANLGAEDTTEPYSAGWDTTALADGSHTLTAVARDAADNSTTSAAVAVNVDNTPPQLTITSPSNGSIVTP